MQKRFVLFFATLLSGAVVHAQSGLSSSDLKVSGLNYESEATAIYLGDFANARLEPEGNKYAFLLNDFIDAYSKTCDAHLPPNKVALTRERCVQETVTRNGFGVETNRYCSQYVTEKTGYFADPDLLRISKALEQKMSQEIIGSIIPQQGTDAGATARRLTDIALAGNGDMAALLNQNRCTSPALKRFQANLERFGTNQAPLRLANGATLKSVRGSDGPYIPSDYGKLIDALIAKNAQGWAFNRYIRGSVSGVNVGATPDGRPNTINARYRFSQLGQPNNGSVRVTFKDGRPACLYFFDAPRTCRIPSPGIVTAYEKGEFR
ncbi:MAG: hypothetical protein AAFQ34_08115 [Pseudomonadota bacterium]